jgi:hypothetical protein
MVHVIKPYLGENMARSAVNLHKEKLGLHTPHPTSDELERLLERMSPALRVFVGQERAALIIAEIRGAIAVHGAIR